MGKEKQNTEWKKSWRDDYFKWICGFANAWGGTLFIGKDDEGHVENLHNARKLLEDLPNQVRDLLGLMVDVNLHTENGADFLEILVEPYPFPISLRGKYYYRSGSTLQELKGPALAKFLLQRQGKKWDGVPVPNVTADDLKNDTFDFFRKKATKSKRLEPEDFREIILFIQEAGSITNSAVQTLCKVSKATATRYLGELEDEWIEKIGTTGVGTRYVFKRLHKGSEK